MFQGKADEAMNLYVSIFGEAAILDVERYGAGERRRASAWRKALYHRGFRSRASAAAE